MDFELLREKALSYVDINKIQKIYLDITKININEYLRISKFPDNSKIIVCKDGKELN